MSSPRLGAAPPWQAEVAQVEVKISFWSALSVVSMHGSAGGQPVRRTGKTAAIKPALAT
jgi:hypothetical protein